MTIAPERIIEAPRPLINNVAEVSAQKMRIRIIEGNRWGSSGYYPREVLERDGPTAFPIGTHMYLDHPGEEESWDRPERTIRDLAATITSTPAYEGDGLYADVNVYSHMAPVISEVAEDIGVSIRALATSKPGERDGRSGMIITSLVEGISVDFVTRAGAGGKIVQLIESAKSKMTPEEIAEVESVVTKPPNETKQPVQEATSSTRRRQLDSVLREAYGDDDTWIWTRDFDETRNLVWYMIETPESSVTWQEGYSVADDDNSVTLLGDAIEVVVQTVYVPVNPAEGTPTPTEESSTMAEIDDAKLQQLTESARRADELKDELEAAKAEAKESRIAEAKATRKAHYETARRIVADEMSTAGVKGSKLAEALAYNPPTTEGDNPEVDDKKLRESVREALGEVATNVDEGGVRGFGANAEESAEVSDEDIDNLIHGSFGSSVKGV